MGREAMCTYSWQGQTGQGKALLEAEEIVLRGDIRTRIPRHAIFAAETKAAGVWLANNGLSSVADASTVRVRDGKTLIVDGPFAETHEQLGGYFLLDCKDLDEAISWAAKIPGAKYGSVEVRPLNVWSQE